MSIQIMIILYAFFLIGNYTIQSNPEYCDFYNHVNCKPEEIEGYIMSSLSKAHKISIEDTIIYEVVFYGGNEIIIQCCTEDDFYPVHFKLRSSERGNVIYDNQYNNYLDHINLQLDYTELLSVEISVEPQKRKARKTDKKINIGLAIYIEDAFFKTVHDKNKI